MKSKLKIALALQVGKDGLKIGQMMCDSITKIGHIPYLVSNENRDTLKPDILLLGGDGRLLDECVQSFRKNQKKLSTVLWQVDCLPPYQLSKNAVNTLRKSARYNRKYLPESVSARTTIRRLDKISTRMARWYCCRVIRKDLKTQNCYLCDTASDHQLFTAATRYLSIKWYYENGWIDDIVTSTKARQTFLQKNGINATFVPFGYHRLWGHKLDLTRDIDVVFIGRLRRDRRRKILEKCSKILKSHGIKIHIAENNCYGDERTKLLNRSKIVLDIMRIPWEMPVMRLLMSMGCGALVVSDWTQDPEPFRPEHLVQAESDKLASVIIYYLQNPLKREKIINTAYSYVTNQLTLTQSISEIIEVANVMKIV